MDLVMKMVGEMMDGLYGPKFCTHCGKVQPVRTYEVQGSQKNSYDGTTVTSSFIGSRVCSVCYHEIDADKGGVR